MNQVVTELVIDADGASRGAEQYIRAMSGAEGAARKGTEANSAVNASLQGMAIAAAAGVAGLVAAQAGLRGFVDMIGGINRQFVDLDERARRAGETLKSFQQLQFSARSSGVSSSDFFSGVERLNQQISDAGRGVTEFGKLFEKNGLSIRNANGDLKSTREVIADISGMLRNAPTAAVEAGVGRVAGLSKEWVTFLRQGMTEIDRMGMLAEQAGDLVTRSTVDQARQFQDEWHKAVAAWELQLRASIQSILPLLQAMASAAVFVLNVTGKVTEFFASAATPVESMGDKALKQRLEDVMKLRGEMASLAESQQIVATTYENGAKATGDFGKGIVEIQNALKDARLRNLKSLLLGDDAADLAQADAMISKIRDLMRAREDAAKATSLTVKGNGSTQLPDGKQETTDAVDRLLQTLTRQVEVHKADAAALGLGARAMAEYRAEALLTAAVQANGGKITDEQAAKYEKLRTAAGDAAEALARARVNSDIDFQRKTAFMSQEDVAIARQLSGIYGNDVTAALNSSEAAAIRFNNALKSGWDGLKGFASDILSGLMQGKSAMEALGAAATRLSQNLAQSALTNLFSGNFVMAGIQGVGALITGLFGRSQQRREEERRAMEQAIQRQQGYMDRATSAGLDTSTREGALAQQEIQFQRERLAEAQAGGLAMYQLLNAQGAERLALQRDWDQRELEQERLKREEVLKRQETFQDRLFAAANDNSTLEGALAEFDRKALKERMDEVRAGGEAVNDLEAALAAERLNIIERFNEEARRAGEELIKFVQGIAKQVRQYLDSLRVGSDSILSPQARLAAAQSQFDQQLAKAMTGDRDALQSITQYAGALIEQAKSFFGSTGGYTSIFNAVTAGLENVIGLSPGTVASNDAVVAAINQTTQAVNTTGASSDQLANLQNTTLSGLALLNNTLNSIADRQGRQDASTAATAITQMNSLLGIQNAALAQLASISHVNQSWGSFSFGATFQFQNGGRVPGYLDGGMITNGDWNRDSVMAMTPRGPAMFAGGEFIMPAPQTRQNLPLLEAMRAGLFPANDRGANDNGRYFAAIDRTLVGGFNGLAGKLEEVIALLKRGERSSAPPPVVVARPGRKSA